MAITYLNITVSNPSNPKKKTNLEFLVDSGAIYSIVPSQLLKNLNIAPEEEREFILANGKKIKRKLGIARFELNGHKGGASVIFGQRGDSTLLGATTLESMGMALDPIKRKLIPLPMVL